MDPMGKNQIPYRNTRTDHSSRHFTNQPPFGTMTTTDTGNTQTTTGSGLNRKQEGYLNSLSSSAEYTLSGNNNNMPSSNPQNQLEESRGIAPISDVLNDEHVSILLEQGYSYGLAKALAENSQSFYYRIWVVDNSGSMQIDDGHRVHKRPDGQTTMDEVSRWEEIQDTVIYHSQMAAFLNSSTRFRLLNHPGRRVGSQDFAVGCQANAVDSEIRIARNIISNAKPDGVTPLTQHVWQIQAEIRQILPELQQSGKRVAVILATDGLPTDDQGYGGDAITNDFIQALRSLEGLPVWLVIRLCTDEENVTNFYNELDSMLELSLEVLDDFLGESKEVQSQNPWLNYALPMHRCRELGYHDRLFDLIDERPLTKGELRDFCVLLFGNEYATIPDPIVDWKGFLTYVESKLKDEKSHWNPVKKREKPWISVKKLDRIYNGGKCAMM